MQFFKRFTISSLVGGLMLLAATTASANLLINGGFENNVINSGTWKAFVSSEVDGWSGSNVEIWNAYNNVTAYEGSNFAELNADPGTGSAFSIYQSFATTANQQYDLSFAYRARASDSEEFNAMVGEAISLESEGVFQFQPFQTWSVNDHGTDGWSLFTGTFVAVSDLTTLMFMSVIPATGTIGNFLDGAVVTASVPEPGTLALLGLGLVGLMASRRRN